MPETTAPPEKTHHRFSLHVGTHRIESLVDGVFSITMTILVFNLKVPELRPDQERSSEALLSALLLQWPNYLAFAISFILLGINWTGLRAQYHFMRRVDHESQWLTIIYLAAVSLFPFTTELLAAHPTLHLTLYLYGLNLTVMGLLLYVHWIYAVTRRRLVEPDLPEAVVLFGTFRSLAAPLGYLIAMAFIWYDPELTLLLYAVVPVVYLFPFTHRHLLRWLLRRHEAQTRAAAAETAAREHEAKQE